MKEKNEVTLRHKGALNSYVGGSISLFSLGRNEKYTYNTAYWSNPLVHGKIIGSEKCISY